MSVFRFHAWRWCITEQSAAYPVIVQSYPLSSHSSQPRQGAADRVFLAANSLNTQMSSLDNWKSTVSCLAASLCRLDTLLRPPPPSHGPAHWPLCTVLHLRMTVYCPPSQDDCLGASHGVSVHVKENHSTKRPVSTHSELSQVLQDLRGIL